MKDRIASRFVATCFFVICAIVEVANAAPLRLKVRPSTGELVKVEHPCGKEIAAALWKRVFRAFFVEVDEDGKLTAWFEDAARLADRVIASEPFIGFFDQDATTTYVISVRDRARGKKLVPVEIAIIVRKPGDRGDACSEKWLGLAERL